MNLNPTSKIDKDAQKAYYKSVQDDEIKFIAENCKISIADADLLYQKYCDTPEIIVAKYWVAFKKRSFDIRGIYFVDY